MTQHVQSVVRRTITVAASEQRSPPNAPRGIPRRLNHTSERFELQTARCLLDAPAGVLQLRQVSVGGRRICGLELNEDANLRHA